MGCMNKLESDGSCSHCSYTDGSPYIKIYLPPKTVLCDRYLVGKVLSYNGEGASYIGFDMTTETKVVIHEYMPESLCTRTPDKTKVIVSSASVDKYKTYMAEFAELNKTLSGLKNISNIVPAQDMFAENNTMYSVTPYIEGISLKKFLQTGNSLSWAQIKKLFPPIFTALGLIHNNGIIHGGICPENMLITTKGEIKLIGFSVTATRVAESDLTSDLNPGYAAPEQYGAADWLGTYTDVYGMCAVLYKILTGVTPPSGRERQNLDRIVSVGQLNPDVPKHVSDALMRGLSVEYRDRTTTITELVTALFAEPEFVEHQKGSTQLIAKQPQHRQAPDSDYDEYEEEDEGTKKKNLTATIIGAVALAAVVGIGLFLLADMFTPNKGDNSSGIVTTKPIETQIETTVEQTTTADETAEATTAVDYGTGAVMPALVGLNYDSVKEAIESDFYIVTKDVTSEEYDEGIIVSQSIPEGVEYNPTGGLTLELEISTGSGKVSLPDYTGLVSNDYLNALYNADISYYYDYEYSDTVEYGYITRVVWNDKEVKPGDELILSDDDLVTVYISMGSEY